MTLRLLADYLGRKRFVCKRNTVLHRSPLGAPPPTVFVDRPSDGLPVRVQPVQRLADTGNLPEARIFRNVRKQILATRFVLTSPMRVSVLGLLSWHSAPVAVPIQRSVLPHLRRESDELKAAVKDVRYDYPHTPCERLLTIGILKDGGPSLFRERDMLAVGLRYLLGCLPPEGTSDSTR